MNKQMWIAMCAVTGLWLGCASAVRAQKAEAPAPAVEEAPMPPSEGAAEGEPPAEGEAAPDGGGEGGGTDFKQLTKEEAPETLEELEKEGSQDPVDEGAPEGASEGTPPVVKAPADAKAPVDPKEAKNLEMEGLIHWMQTRSGVGYNGKPYDFSKTLENLDAWKSAFDLGPAPGNELAGMSEEEQKKALLLANGKMAAKAGLALASGNPDKFVKLVAKETGKALVVTGYNGMVATAMQNVSSYNLAFHEHVRQSVENGAGREPRVAGNTHLMTFFDQRRALIEQVTGESAPRPDASGRYDHAAVQGYMNRHSLSLYTHVGMLRETTKGDGFPLGGGVLGGSGRWDAGSQYSPDYYKRVVLPKLRAQLGQNGGFAPPLPQR